MEGMASLLVVAVQIDLVERNKINFSVIKKALQLETRLTGYDDVI